ncbi:MAG TPA: LytTR family transcriptional regulator DNA-binding domain-containing protein [Dehalococcoidia bacterium]|nr:LytTR family transcriptional regulator DNA-binding domain-containing protein [Dehalococcoidia bacterium]
MLQVRHLEKIVEGRSALAIDALDVAAGDVIAVIGPQSSGKSLLVQLLAGLMPPSGGSAVLDGAPILAGETAKRARERGPIGVLLADDLLYDRMSAAGNLAFYCRWQGLPAGRAGEALALVGLSDQAQTVVKKLDPSARRRLAFARALLGRPRLLLLDRPVLRADFETQRLFARLIRQAAEGGALVLLTDEDLAWAGTCATRVVELQDGRVVNCYALRPPGEGGEGGDEGAPERMVPFKVPARKDDRILLYDPGDILYATSRDGRTYLRTACEEAVTTSTLQELEARLAGRGFFKAHRAYLVNLQHVKAVIQFSRNSYLLQLDDTSGSSIPLSRQSEKALQDLLGY